MSENNRYLFKAKRKDNGEWAEGYYQQRKDCFGNDEHLIFRCENYHTWEYVEVDSTTICQCTGLRDKNGNLIWENDIVTYTDELVNKVKIDKIGWNETHAAFTRLHKSQMGLQYLYINESIAKKCEVIGNIFDNPELLE